MQNSQINLNTSAKNTWCPGCGNFAILSAIKEAIKFLIEKKKIEKERFVLISGIGCHAKIVDYINLNSFYSIHGRVIPPGIGMKLANPNLYVIGFSGDGDAYDEGISHLIFAAKRNVDLTLIVHDNRNFALTTSQFTATSPEDFKGKSTPKGTYETPFNPLFLAFASGATFIARGFTFYPEKLKEIFIEAISHKGFSFVEVLQSCISFYDMSDLKERVYWLKNHNFSSEKEALEKIREWDYQNKGKIPLGIFYKKR